MATEWKNLPDTSTPITAANLIADQTAVQNTQPTGGQGVWIKDSKNLFDKSNVINGYRFGSDGALFSDATYSASDFIEIKPSETYKLTRTRVTGNSAYCLYDSSKNFISREFTGDNNSITITTTSATKYIRIADLTSNLGTIMLEYGSTAHAYEPFITPTINTNINGQYKEIYNKDNMGDLVVDSIKGKNLFGVELGNYSISSDGSIVANNIRISTMDYIEVESGNYTLSYNGNLQLFIRTFNSNKQVVGTISQNWVDKPYTFSIGSGVKYIKIMFRKSDDSNVTPNDISNIQLEKGSTATNYVPYNRYSYNSEESMGSIVVDNVQGKNLLPLRNKSGELNGVTYSWEGTKVTLNGTASAATNIYNVGSWGNTNKLFELKNGTYTSSVTGANNINRFGVYMLGGNDGTVYILSQGNDVSTKTITLDSKKNINSFYISIKNGAVFNNETFYLQLEKGSEATSYAPYKSFDATAYVLWTNPSPTSSFEAQSILLNDNVNNYKYLEIIYKGSASGNTFASSKFLPIGETYITYENQYIWRRNIPTINNNAIYIEDAGYYATYGSATKTTANTVLIPYQILGYK